MVIVIHQASSTANALFYNERKVKDCKATFYDSRNTPSTNPFVYSTQHRHQIFKRIEDSNARVKNKGLHISFNPTISDMVRLGEKGIRTEINRLMEHLGYGSQPYFVYKHADIDRVHFHVVSTRIDKQTGKKVKDNYEKEKVQKFISELKQTYQLTNDEPNEKINLKFTAYSKNLKQNLESLFKELNRMDFITSKQMYNDALRLFHIEIKPANKGHLLFVTDGIGNPVRHPIKMSDFQNKPKLYMTIEKSEKIVSSYFSHNYIENDRNLEKTNQTKLHHGNCRILFDLLWMLPNYSNSNNLRNKKQMIKRKKRGLEKI